MNVLGNSLVNEKWEHVLCEDDIDGKLQLFTRYVFSILNEIAPVKLIRISCDDPVWMNTRIKTQIRKRNREFDKSNQVKIYFFKQICGKISDRFGLFLVL